MRLDRYINPPGQPGKFSIIENQKDGRRVEVGDPVDDFVVIKLKDINAFAAFAAYAESARKHGDEELAQDMERLSMESGPNHPHCHVPD